MITKGQIVTFKPEWQDTGDEGVTFVAAEDQDGDRVLVCALIGLSINPTQVVTVDMLA